MSERLLSRQQVAEWLGVPAGTLARWAYVGEGPRFFKIGRHCRYDESDVKTWLETREAGRVRT
jgi:excisionase family DNA binding protein